MTQRGTTPMRHTRFVILLIVAVALMLLPVSALPQTGVGVKRNPHTHGAGNAAVYDVTDAQFGAIADAVEASGCEAGEDTPFNCTTPGTGTDNNAAFQAAIDAAEVNGGEVYIPCGKYRISRQVEIDESDVTVRGGGACSVLLPGGTDGMVMFRACDIGGDNCAVQIDNIHFRDLVFRDDDPFAHGCQQCEVVNVDSIQDFDYAEPLVIGGLETAYFYWQEATTGNDKTLIYTGVSAATVTDGDQIVGQNTGSTATIDGDPVHESTEETHAIFFGNAENFSVENCRFEFMGDESIVMYRGANLGRIHDNGFINNPGTPSGGSPIEVTGATNIQITNNSILGGLGSGYPHSSGAIAVAGGNGTTTANILVANNSIIEPDDDADDHTSIEYGIGVFANSFSAVDGVLIEGNYVELEIDIWGTCTVAGTICDEDGDCGANYCDAATYNAGCAGATSICNAVIADEGGGNTIGALGISDNRINGAIHAVINTASAPLNITNNNLVATHGTGITAEASNLLIDGNSIVGHGNQGILIPVGAGTVVISNNVVSGTGTELVGVLPGAIVISSANSVDQGLIAGNVITGVNVAAITYSGIDCNSEPDVIVEGNKIITADGDGIEECAVVIGNYIDTPTITGITTNRHDTTILDNYIVSPGVYCIESDSRDRLLIDGNHGTDCEQTGIFIDTTTGSTISNNYMEGDGSDIGISCDDCNTTKIIGNTVENFTDAGIISIIESGTTSDYNLCLGNISLDNGSTILCGPATVGAENCTTEVGAAANTVCENNIIGP